jgi:type IV secretory pathway TraG/TraD family ATPase VirD4
MHDIVSGIVSGIGVWWYIVIALLLLIVVAVAVWALYRGMTLFQKDKSSEPWATKKEVKKYFRVTTAAGAHFNIAKYSFMISAALVSIFYLLAVRYLGKNPGLYGCIFLLLVFFACSYALIRQLVQYAGEMRLPDHPKGKDKIYSWLLCKFSPPKDFYYIGKAYGIKVGLPRLKRYEHILVVGPTGSKKSSAFIIPQLLMDADGNGSAFCPDAKSPEIFDIVAGRWIAKGKKAVIFDPWDDRCRGFNPLFNADDEDINSIVDVFLQEREDVLKEQNFFRDRTREYLFAMLKLVRTLNEEYRNLVTVYKMTENVSILEQFIGAVHDDSITRKFHDFLKMTQSDKINTLSNIRGKLNIFLDPKVCAAFSRSDFTLDIMFREKEPCLLVVGAPVNKSETGQKIASLITNLLIKRAFQEKQLGDQAKAKGSKHFEHGGLYIYGDEIRSLRITNLADVISIGRYARAQMLVTSTDMGFFQYYRQDFGSINANLKTKVFLSKINDEDAKMVSDKIGKIEVPEYRYLRSPITGITSKQMVGFEMKPAMTALDIIHMPKNTAIVFTPDTKPLKVKIQSIHETRWLKKLVHPAVSKRKLFRDYKKRGVNISPLVAPQLPMLGLQFCDLKKVKQNKKESIPHVLADEHLTAERGKWDDFIVNISDDEPIVISDGQPEKDRADDAAMFMP